MPELNTLRVATSGSTAQACMYGACGWLPASSTCTRSAQEGGSVGRGRPPWLCIELIQNVWHARQRGQRGAPGQRVCERDYRHRAAPQNVNGLLGVNQAYEQEKKPASQPKC